MFSTPELLEEENRESAHKDLTGSPGGLEGVPSEVSRGPRSGSSDRGSGQLSCQAAGSLVIRKQWTRGCEGIYAGLGRGETAQPIVEHISEEGSAPLWTRDSRFLTSVVPLCALSSSNIRKVKLTSSLLQMWPFFPCGLLWEEQPLCPSSQVSTGQKERRDSQDTKIMALSHLQGVMGL